MRNPRRRAARLAAARFVAVVALCASLWRAPAFAQGEAGESDAGEGGLEEIVVIANRIPVPLHRVAASVTVINAADLDAHGDFGLLEILRQTPGVSSGGNGGLGAVAALRVRGEESYRTQVIFDGLKLIDPGAPQAGPLLHHILAGDVGRVEILRGPQGPSYGADAGGVVRIDSRRPEPGLRLALDFQGGSRDTAQVGAVVSFASRRGDWFLSANRVATDGYNAREDDASQDRDGYENNTVHLRAGLNFAAAWRIEAVYRRVDAMTKYDRCGFPTIHDCEEFHDLQAGRLALEYAGEGFRHSLAWSAVDMEREDYAAGVFAFDGGGEIRRLEYLGGATALPGFDLIVGVDVEQEQHRDTDRDSHGYYLEALSDFSERLSLSASARRDENEDYAGHTSFRLGAAWLQRFGDDQLRLRGSYGNGFRAPSLYEVGYNAGPFAAPPAAATRLQEETSRGLEFGLEYRAAAGARIGLVFFEQEIEDAIYWDSAGNSGYLQDTGATTSKGLEFAAEYPLARQWLASANFTYNDTERPDGAQRLRRPKYLANFGLHYHSPADRFRLSGFLRLSRNAIDIGAKPLDNFAVLDLTAAWRVSARFEFIGRIENALDESYSEVSGYRAPGLAAYLGFRTRY